MSGTDKWDCFVLSGNLHQSQYCEKIKSILEFLGQQLSMEELTTMWEMQVDKNPVQVSAPSPPSLPPNGVCVVVCCRLRMSMA